MHDFTAGPSDYVALYLTKWDNLYYCMGADEHLLFHFYSSQPSEPCFEDHLWSPVKDLRNTSSSPGYVDSWFKRSMSMYTPTPEGKHLINLNLCTLKLHFISSNKIILVCRARRSE